MSRVSRLILLLNLSGLLSVAALAAPLSDSLCPGMEFKRFYHDNGQVSSEGCWDRGKPEGEWKNYDRNGVLLSKGARKNLKLDGLWTFYKDGKPVSEITYKNDRKNGPSRSFTEDRIIESFYVNDTLQGLRIIKDTFGNLLQTTIFKDGSENGIEKKYNHRGDVFLFTFYRRGMVVFRQEVNFRDDAGLKQGIWKDFYDNGSLHWECSYKADLKDGYYKLYDSTGNLVKIEKYAAGVLQNDAPELADIRIHTEYYANGKPKFRVAYKNGKPEGVCRQYDSITGKVTRGIIFENGEVVGTEDNLDEQGNKSEERKEYYPDGKLKSIGRVYRGKKQGVWKYFYPDGSVEQEGEYRSDVYDGTWLWYYPDGTLRLEQEYYRGKLDGNSVEYDDSARVVASGKYVEGLEEGRWEYRRGSEWSEGNYVSGEKDGVWKSYWLVRGKKILSFRGRFTLGLPDGHHEYFSENGLLREEGDFRQGKRVGTWIKYDKEGLPEMRIRYDNLEEETHYNGKRTVTKEEEQAYREEIGE